MIYIDAKALSLNLTFLEGDISHVLNFFDIHTGQFVLVEGDLLRRCECKEGIKVGGLYGNQIAEFLQRS